MATLSCAELSAFSVVKLDGLELEAVAWGLDSAEEQQVSLVVAGAGEPGRAEGWLGSVAADLLESCEFGGGLQHDEGLVGGGQLLE